ncbi:MAG: WecB/TagA/CpsF family glycosyltransferase [Cyanobacteria bacterium P01_G01_bin.4]
MNRVRILNTSLHSISKQQLLDRLKDGGSVFTLNVDHLMKLQKDFEFYSAYSAATYRVCDSQIIKTLTDCFFPNTIQEKISGSDLLPAYIEHYKHDPEVKLFLLGAAEGVADAVRTRVNAEVGREMIVDVYSPPFGFHTDPTECEYINERIKQSGATTLAVGLGAPKQEIWIAQNQQKLPGVKVFLAVGAALDFEAGNLSRCPAWMSNGGLEWLHRLVSEPRRLWRRYLLESLPLLWLLPMQFVKLYRPPEFPEPALALKFQQVENETV